MSHNLMEYFRTALAALGPQHWWPGETPFEVCVGAILTQNTNWKNVEKAIANLKEHRLLEPRRLAALTAPEIAPLIRPAGYFNIKARRLKSFLNFLMQEYDGDLEKMFGERLEDLREKLLAVSGIGPETADSILLYGAQKPIFVVDAYTKRIFLRHEAISDEADYHQIQEHFMDHLPREGPLFNEFHALIVAIGKNWCHRTTPDCDHCPWQKFLPGTRR